VTQLFAVREWDAYGCPIRGGVKVKKTALVIGGALLVLAVVLVGRALRVRSRQVAVAPAAAIPIDAEHAAAGLAEAVRLRTVSTDDPAQFDGRQFVELQRF
jgi:carboxypeptidase PM20D1